VGNEQTGTLLRHLRGLAVRDVSTLSDPELMQRFVSERDPVAFEALLRRHGAMVLRVCRRVLRDEHDAEDAFQATFLVLARKAATLRRQESVGNWLYGVASRLSLRARADAARRRDRERRPAQKGGSDLLTDLTVREARQILDEELSRLPDRYRAPLVLCSLEGLARDEAAQQLGCGAATLKSRLERARALLRKRLGRRGLTLPAALVASLLTASGGEAAAPALLVSGTVKAATAFAVGSPVGPLASATAVALAEGAMASLSGGKFRLVALVLLATVVCASGTGILLGRSGGPAPPEATPETPIARAEDEKATPAAVEKPRPAESADWPQWRGPNRDGVARGVSAPAKWPKALTEEWKVEVGKGVASPVVVGGSIYLLVRDKKDDEVVLCHDLQTGDEKWHSEPYPAPYKIGPGEGTADDRPRSTPAVADGRVFTLGMTGILSCFDAKTGKLLWRKDTKFTHYGGSSPLVVDGLCLAVVGDGAKTGGLTAFDVKTGDVKWCFADGASGTSGSPILVDLAGERQLVTYSNWNACGVSAGTGKKLWGVGPGGAGMPCTTPARYKDWIILADNMDSLRALRLEKGDKGLTAKQVWKSNDELKLYYSSPVVIGDLVFGMSTKKAGCFFCLDATSGKTLWEGEGRQGGYASFVSVGNVLLILKDRGQLVVVKPSARAYEPIAEYKVSDRGTLAHPVFLGDRLLIKDDTTLRLFRIAQDGKE
jgi:RNA polymerase sigma factor (sigma-70 family)